MEQGNRGDPDLSKRESRRAAFGIVFREALRLPPVRRAIVKLDDACTTLEGQIGEIEKNVDRANEIAGVITDGSLQAVTDAAVNMYIGPRFLSEAPHEVVEESPPEPEKPNGIEDEADDPFEKPIFDL